MMMPGSRLKQKGDRYPKKVTDPQKSDRGFLKGDRFKNCIKIISSLQKQASFNELPQIVRTAQKDSPMVENINF